MMGAPSHSDRDTDSVRCGMSQRHSWPTQTGNVIRDLRELGGESVGIASFVVGVDVSRIGRTAEQRPTKVTAGLPTHPSPGRDDQLGHFARLNIGPEQHHLTLSAARMQQQQLDRVTRVVVPNLVDRQAVHG